MKKYVMWVNIKNKWSRIGTRCSVPRETKKGMREGYFVDEVDWRTLVTCFLTTNPYLRRAIYFRSASFLEMELELVCKLNS
jgi:hypothetical protein